MELFKAFPDQVTSEQLTVAFRRLESICEITPPMSVMGWPWRPPSRAPRGRSPTSCYHEDKLKAQLYTNPITNNPSIMPPVTYHNIIRHYGGEHNEFMFTAHPDIGLGAYMSMSSCTPTSSNFLYEITIPNDHKIDELLMQEPHNWKYRFQYAMDFRTGRPIASRPFHHDLCDEGANWRYITILQTLTRQLLAITNR